MVADLMTIRRSCLRHWQIDLRRLLRISSSNTPRSWGYERPGHFDNESLIEETYQVYVPHPGIQLVPIILKRRHYSNG